jgi:hypothetical protein
MASEVHGIATAFQVLAITRTATFLDDAADNGRRGQAV